MDTVSRRRRQRTEAANQTVVVIHNDRSGFHHGKHLLLTLLTGGLWLPVWIILYLVSGK